MNEGSITTASNSLSNLNTGRDDCTTSRSPKSRSGSRRRDGQLQKKLEDITKQLSEVREKRLKLKKFDDGRVYGPRTDYTKVPRKLFSHPKLEYVYGEIMTSPYLINPIDKYPKANLELSETVKALKHKNIPFKELPPELKPYDETQVKKQFIREVCNYNPKFNIPKAIMERERKLQEGSLLSSKGTINSAVGSSSKSFKESGSLRHRQLNKLSTRKHPSATSMSLDASGFMPSNRSGTASTTGTTATTGSSLKSAREPNVTASALAEAAQSVFVTGGDGSAGTGTETEPESKTYQEEAVAEDDGDYAEDFDGPASPTKASGKEEGQSAKEVVDDTAEDIYDADFENTAVGVESVEPVAPAPEERQATAEEETEGYQDDFEQNPAPATVLATEPILVPTVPATATSSESRPESLKIRTDLIGSSKNRGSPEVGPAGSPAPSSSSSKQQQQPQQPSSKAPSPDGRPALSKRGTSSSEIHEELTGRGHQSVGQTTPAPCTVRSEAEAEVEVTSPPASVPMAPVVTAPEESVRTGVAELELTDALNASVAYDSEEQLPSVTSVPGGGPVESDVPLVDEPIDEIAYVESRPQGEEGLDGDIQSNNYVHSPQRPGDTAGARPTRSDSIAEDEGAEAGAVSSGGSPARLGDQPDEEIREEIE